MSLPAGDELDPRLGGGLEETAQRFLILTGVVHWRAATGECVVNLADELQQLVLRAPDGGRVAADLRGQIQLAIGERPCASHAVHDALAFLRSESAIDDENPEICL